jgi:hypothetical protein
MRRGWAARAVAYPALRRSNKQICHLRSRRPMPQCSRRRQRRTSMSAGRLGAPPIAAAIRHRGMRTSARAPSMPRRTALPPAWIIVCRPRPSSASRSPAAAPMGLANALGTGRSDALQVGGYGITRFGPAYLAGALAFTNNWFTTNRSAISSPRTSPGRATASASRAAIAYRSGIRSA